MAVKQKNDGTQGPGGNNSASGPANSNNVSITNSGNNKGHNNLCGDVDGGGGGGGGVSPLLMHDNEAVEQGSPIKNNSNMISISNGTTQYSVNTITVGPTFATKDITDILHLIDLVDTRFNTFSPNDMISFYQHVIQELAGVAIPRNNLAGFKENINLVGEFFARANDKRMYLYFLRLVYQLITQCNAVTPSSAVAIIFQLFQHEMIIEAVNSMLELSIPDEELRRTVLLLSQWLRTTNFCTNLNLWIMALICGIKNQNRIELFNTICLENIEQLFASMIVPVLRPKCAPLVFHILTNVTDTHQVFHKIIPKYPSVVTYLKTQAQTNEDTKQTLQKLVDLTCGLMVRFYGHEDVYKVVEGAIKDIQPSCNYLYYAKIPHEATEDNDIRRGSNAKVGLVNLGNTCYMNSVLQALAMTKDFSREILLTRSPSPLIVKMQQQIALMLYSLRYELVPSRILSATRPPGFVAGLQQDSSEFLSYLLDTLHEQEVAYRDTSNHIIIQEIDQNDSRKQITNIVTPITIQEGGIITTTLPTAEIKGYDHLPQIGEVIECPINGPLWETTDATTTIIEEADLEHCSIVAMDFTYSNENNDIINEVDIYGPSNDNKISLSSDDEDDCGIVAFEANVQIHEPGDHFTIIEQEQNQNETRQFEQENPSNISDITTIHIPAAPNPPSSDSSSSSVDQSSTTIEKTFNGKLATTYTCLSCGGKSRNIDCFRDLQLSFPEDEQSRTVSNYSVQDLIDYYCSPEKLVGDNQYFCEHCGRLSDAERSITFMSAPKNLILTLKHFKYDQRYHMRAKLMHKVYHDEKIFLKIRSSDTEKKVIVYDLYAGVVHSGYSMDSGHYYTYATDGTNNWYKFDDNTVTPSDTDELHNLSPPNTPYILFYHLSGQSDDNTNSRLTNNSLDTATAVATTEINSVVPIDFEKQLKIDELPVEIRSYVIEDNNAYVEEERAKRFQITNNKYRHARNDNIIRRDGYGDDDDDLPPQSGAGGCGGNPFGMNVNRFVY